MSPERQRIVIAEACGYKNCRQIGGVFGSQVWVGEYGTTTTEHALHSYLHDLNAMHEAERILSETQRMDFIVQLMMVVGPSARMENADDWQNTWYEIHAARQRAARKAKK